MTAIDDLFVEIEHHKIMMAHASLVLAAKSEYALLLADNIGNRKAWDDCFEVNCELRAELAQLREVSERRREDLEMAVGKWQQLRAEVDAKVGELVMMRNKLADAIELATEGISYTSPYFVDKWGMQDTLNELKAFYDLSARPTKDGDA